MRRMVTALAVLAALPLLGGYIGEHHPIGDSLAVFRAPGALLLAFLSLLALAKGARRTGLAGLALAAFAGLPLALAAWGPWTAGTDLRLYQKNLRYDNSELVALEADIRAADPDVLTLQEVSEANLPLLAALKDILPHQHWCPFAAVGGTAVATRLPPVAGQAVCAEGMTALEVEGPKGPLWLISVHLFWPWPHGQSRQVEDLVAVLQDWESPVVMAGDFNMVPWSDAMSALRWAAGVRHAGPLTGTYTGFRPWLTLPIDHVMSLRGGRMATRPALGSDHLGLLADLNL